MPKSTNDCSFLDIHPPPYTQKFVTQILKHHPYTNPPLAIEIRFNPKKREKRNWIFRNVLFFVTLGHNAKCHQHYDTLGHNAKFHQHYDNPFWKKRFCL
jgi:hypothetical protein